MRRWYIFLLLLVTTILLRKFSPYWVGITIGESMTPELKPNQIFVMDRTCYRDRLPARNDVVVFRCKGDVYVKRVLALPGDALWIHCYNGDPACRQVIDLNMLDKYRRYIKLGSEEKLQHIVVPKDSLFVVGDSISMSKDSRHFGPISARQLIGKVCYPAISLPSKDVGTFYGCVRYGASK